MKLNRPHAIADCLKQNENTIVKKNKQVFFWLQTEKLIYFRFSFHLVYPRIFERFWSHFHGREDEERNENIYASISSFLAQNSENHSTHCHHTWLAIMFCLIWWKKFSIGKKEKKTIEKNKKKTICKHLFTKSFLYIFFFGSICCISFQKYEKLIQYI